MIKFLCLIFIEQNFYYVIVKIPSLLLFCHSYNHAIIETNVFYTFSALPYMILYHIGIIIMYIITVIKMEKLLAVSMSKKKKLFKNMLLISTTPVFQYPGYFLDKSPSPPTNGFLQNPFNCNIINTWRGN